MTRIGDTVTGRGRKSKKQVHIVVDKIGYDDAFVTGRVITRGRLTSRRETITTKPLFDIFTETEIPGGWTPSDAVITFTKSFSSTLADMEVGDQISVDRQQHKVTTCRNIAARIAVDEGRVYTVNRTPEGCTITRKA